MDTEGEQFSSDDEDQPRGRRGGGNGYKGPGRPHFRIERFDWALEAAKKAREAARAERAAKAAGKPVVAPEPKMKRSDLSPDQVRVYDAVMSWYGSTTRKPFLKFGGLAGTGKTTLISVLAGALRGQSTTVAFGAYTGKAANVLGQKLTAAGVAFDSCGTLHSMMYAPIVHDHEDPRVSCSNGEKCKKIGRVEGWGKRAAIEAGLVIVDEASMINQEIWKDLLSFNVPVLAVGDHGQLPPIGRDNVNLMMTPDLVLEKIHRQAEGNPIIALAHHVRQGGKLFQFHPSDDRVIKAGNFMGVVGGFVDRAMNDGDDMTRGFLERAVICGKNATRATVNRLFREARGFNGPAPDPGDIVIALKNFKPVFNGMRGVFEGSVYNFEDLNDYGMFEGSVAFMDDGFAAQGTFNIHQFYREKTFEHPKDVPRKPGTEAAEKWKDTGLLVDYGYALTCHKAQGSQFKEAIVCAYDAFGNRDDRRRWLYTACTRAAERLIVVGG